MPIEGSVGQSDYTAIKQRHFAAIIKTHLQVAKGIMSRNKYPNWIEPYYLYVDLYAGCGNNLDDVPGSPVIFFDQAKKVDVNGYAVFVEENEYSAELLEDKIKNIKTCNYKLITDDNANIVKQMVENPPDKKCLGLAYLDPNGIPNFNAIKELSHLKQYDKFDFLINCPATAIKRSLGNGFCDDSNRLISELVGINKNYWIIREPIGRWQWTFLIGTNWESFPKFKNLGFHPLSSNKGREIVMHLSYTAKELQDFKELGWYQSYKEYLQHPFFKIVRKEVMARSWGNLKKYRQWGPICELCNEEFASEPHHKVYPPWNTFDVPENLMAVCHKCHCALHNKEV